MPGLGPRDARGVRAGVRAQGHGDRGRPVPRRPGGLQGDPAQEPGEDRHPDRDPARGLLEVDAPRVRVDLVADLVPPRQRVHHHGVPQGLRRHGPLLQPEVGGLGELAARVSLRLRAGHVDRVHALHLPPPGVREEGELVRLLRGQVDGVAVGGEVPEAPRVGAHRFDLELLVQPLDHVVGQLEPRLRDADDVGPEAREGVREGVDRPAVLEVAGEHHVEALDPPPLHVEVVEVAEGLGRVLEAPVPGVDHGDRRVARREAGRALARVPEHDHVGVAAADHADRVREGLALHDAGAGHLRRREHAPSEAQHGGLEGQARPGGGLVEEARGDEPGAGVGEGAGIGGEPVGEPEQPVHLLDGDVVDGHQVTDVRGLERDRRGARGVGGVRLGALRGGVLRSGILCSGILCSGILCSGALGLRALSLRGLTDDVRRALACVRLGVLGHARLGAARLRGRAPRLGI